MDFYQSVDTIQEFTIYKNLTSTKAKSATNMFSNEFYLSSNEYVLCVPNVCCSLRCCFFDRLSDQDKNRKHVILNIRSLHNKVQNWNVQAVN